MGIIEFCLKKPVLVAVAVTFLLLAGIWALFSIPIQLTPDVETPKVTVRTYWPGASPYEVEREIVKKQEEFLNKIPTFYFKITGTGDALLVRVPSPTAP